MSSDDVLAQAAQRLRDAVMKVLSDCDDGHGGPLFPTYADYADALISAGLVRAPVPTLDREALGRKVREVWIGWAREQPDPKPSWLVPWEDLSEPDREVDRRIGETLARAGISAGVIAQPPAERDGVALIAAERQRAIDSGWTAEHDDRKTSGSLAEAGICYAANYGDVGVVDDRWPWAIQYWKPTGDRVRDLVKAGQFIAAEIDRLLRARDSSREAGQPPPPDAYVCKCPGSGTLAHVRSCHQHPEAGQP